MWILNIAKKISLKNKNFVKKTTHWGFIEIENLSETVVTNVCIFCTYYYAKFENYCRANINFIDGMW